jgi:drug/metabolite transporter (DMT)-like permease
LEWKEKDVVSMIPFTGELAGLGAAFMWAVATVMFGRLGSKLPPLVLNLYKGLIAIAMIGLVLAVRQEHRSALSAHSFLVLFASGVIGIGFGDSAFFAALNRIGARRTILMAETVAPPLACLIAMGVLAEFLPTLALIGIAITLAGVAWVIFEQNPAESMDKSKLRAGIGFGALAALCQALGAVLSRLALLDTEISPLWSSLIRIGGGVFILIIWIPAARQKYLPSAARSSKLLGFVVVATFIGTFLGILFQQVSLKYTAAGVAQTLLATSSLFVLPLVAIRGERISLRAIAGAVIAVTGIAILFFI